MNKTDIKQIEESLHKFLKQWSLKDLGFYLKDIRYQVDLQAINKNLALPISDLIFRGGKRFRPVIFLTILKLYKKDYKKYFDLAAALEIIHNGTLIHDDIEDDGELRRGKPVCHKKFGIDTAINAGATAYFLPLRIIQANKFLTEKQKNDLFQIYIDEMINVHFGQTIDIYWHKTKPQNISVEKYLEMTRLKTGALLRMAVRFALVIAKQPKNIEKKLISFFEVLGNAFQIKDDLLDLEATKGFGKAFGNDITEGKFSLPVILSLKKASKSDQKKLLRILSAQTKDRAQIKQAIQIIKATGSLQKSAQIADKILIKDWQKLEKLLPKNQIKTEIEEIVNYLVKKRTV